MKQIITASLCFVFFNINLFAQEPPLVDAFQIPFYGSPESPAQSCDFGITNCAVVGEYHLAEDYELSTNDSVYACADGVVKEAQSHDGYGGTVLIEHKLLSGEYAVSLYAHMFTSSLAVSSGQIVTRGTFLGKIADTANNGGWDPHLHFGISKGQYQGSSPGNESCDESGWLYQGYSPNSCTLDEWYDPSDLIDSYQAGVGYYSNGWHTDGTSQEILDRFIEAAHDNHSLGYSVNNGGGYFVHDWYDITLQDFYGADNNYDHPHTAIILNQSGTAAYLLKEGFWDKYMNHEGYRNFGAPTGEEYQDGGLTKQDFEKGTLIWDGEDFSAEDEYGNPIDIEDVTIKPNPPTAEAWHNGTKQGEGEVMIALYEGFTYEYEIKEDGYAVEEHEFTVPSSSSTEEPVLTGGGGSNPANFPLTIEAENMEGPADQVTNGRDLTSEDWYLWEEPKPNFPNAGWVEAEVTAKAGGQVGGVWPKLELYLDATLPAQEINSTSNQSYFFIQEITQGGQKLVELRLPGDTRSTSGHSVIVDKIVLRYVPGPYVPPVANDDLSDVKINNAQDVDVPDNDTDDNSLDLTTVEVCVEPENGETSVNSQTGVITYTPDEDYTGEDSLEYTIRDNEGTISKIGKAKVEVKKIVVTYPTGGESFDYMEMIQATWWDDGSISLFRVEYSVDNGKNWTFAGATPYNNRSFRNTELYSSDSCLVRVKNNSDYDEFDVSDSLFTMEGYHGYPKRADVEQGTESEPVIPTEFALYQNNPNPFNPETQIRFDLPEPAQVQLEIFNILGQRVAILLDQPMLAGEHSVIWNGSDELGNQASSGIYIYTIRAGDFVANKKMLFLK